MRAFIFIAILGVIGYFGYNHFVKPLTGEEREVQVIEKKFDAAVEEYMQAVRKAGGLGMDTVSDADSAVRKVRNAKTALNNLQRRLQDKAARERAEKLDARMRTFFRQNDLIWF